MPFRNRLRNTGLKLKIPSRPSAVSNAKNSSPYSTSRNSASPGKDNGASQRPCWPSGPSPTRESRGCVDSPTSRPSWPSGTSPTAITRQSFPVYSSSKPNWFLGGSPINCRTSLSTEDISTSSISNKPPLPKSSSGAGNNFVKGAQVLPSDRGKQGHKATLRSELRLRSSSSEAARSLTSFDASVNTRPVWAVTNKKPKPTTSSYRDIPIVVCGDNKYNVSPLELRSEDISDPQTESNQDGAGVRTSQPSPESPMIDLSESPELVGYDMSPDLNFQRINQRALHLRDWFHNLSPKCDKSPSITKIHRRNPFFPPSLLGNDPFPRYLAIQPFLPQLKSSPSSSIATSSDGSILTPTENSGEDPLKSIRRDSSGALLSPDPLDPAKGEDGNFYLLKKDSQRRATLVKVLQHDKNNICSMWHSFLQKDTCLTIAHLETLMEGMKGYIPEQSREPIDIAIARLREDLDYDGAKINHLQLALYLFQDAVNSVLRLRAIKPHWMFALDNLVRAAVQAAIVVLSPELGAHLADHREVLADHRDIEIHAPPDPLLEEGGSTSGVSTVNSAGGYAGAAGGPINMAQGLSRVREENMQLLSDLMSAQRSYQELLKQSLSEQKLHLQLLSQSLAASNLRDPSRQQHANLQQQISLDEDSHGSNSDMTPVNSMDREKLVDNVDHQLVAWLEGLGLTQETIAKMTGEDLTLSDVLELMSRDDLRRLGLKAGPELRIWRAVLQHRNVPMSPQ